MHFQFLIEDQSSAVLIEILMQNLISQNPAVTYNCKYFKGIGGFTKKNTVKETKSGKLLNDLATYLRGFSKSLQHSQSAIMIVLDNDDHDPDAFLEELQAVADKNAISADHSFCLAIEEVEAWLLGDQNALLLAYPGAKQAVLQAYKQDSICGTWELLADAIYPGSLKKFKTDCPTYVDVGNWKSECAREIGRYMKPENNISPSFKHFMAEIYKRIPAA